VLWVAALIAGPHLVQDDGRLLRLYIAKVKGRDAAATAPIVAVVDQSFHALALFGLALLVGD
jgi:hypothetical protein